MNTSNASIDLKTGGLLTINNDIAAGSGTVYLTSGAGITEGSAKYHGGYAGDDCGECDRRQQRDEQRQQYGGKTTAGTITYQDADGFAIATVAFRQFRRH